MDTDRILKDIVVQGTLLDFNTDIYASILEKMNSARDFTDPFAKLVASTFKMCDEGMLDPWNVDIKGFSRVFLSIIDDSFDKFGMAGYLIGQAWHILYEKTEESVIKRRKPDPLDLEIDSTAFDDLDISYFVQGPETGTLELKEPVRHREKRQVMLVELLEAIRVAAKKEEKRSRQRIVPEENDEAAMEELIFELHAEEPEREIEETYRKILAQMENIFYIEDVWGADLESRWAFLVYCLFLMRDRRIILRQEGNFGRITIEKVYTEESQMIDA